MADMLDHVHAWIARMRSEMRYSEGTLTKYAQAGEQHALACASRGRPDWSHVTRDDVLADMGAGGCSRKTAALRLTALRSLHRYLNESGVTQANVAASIRTPKLAETAPDVMTLEEVASLIAACHGTHPEDLRDRALVEVAYSTGARAAELIAMRLEDVDLESGSVLLRGKGSKTRFAALGRPAADALRRYLVEGRAMLDGNPNERHVFLSRLHRPFTNMGLWQLLNRRARAAGLRRIHPHLLRHAFAVHMLKGGADARTLQLLLGHAQLSTVTAYLKLDDRWLRESHQRCHPRG